MPRLSDKQRLARSKAIKLLLDRCDIGPSGMALMVLTKSAGDETLPLDHDDSPIYLEDAAVVCTHFERYHMSSQVEGEDFDKLKILHSMLGAWLHRYKDGF